MNLNHFYHYYKSKSGGGVSNLLLGSEELGSTGVGRWNQDLMNAVNSDQVNNPEGTEQTADQLDFQASKSAKIRQDVTLVAGTEYTFSVWARAASGTQPFRLRYYDNVGGSGGASAFTASATWSPTTGRYSFTFTAANSGTFTMMIQNAADGATRRIYFWGAMLNVGATAADYIKTTFTGPSSPATPLMEFGDNFAGVTAYYSLRRFTIGEDTNAIRVRRSSDDTEQDIGFDANGDLDSTALLAFVGQENRFKHSDPASGDYATLLNGSTSTNDWGLSSPSFTNKTILDRDLGNALAYPPFDLVETGETYTMSAYVKILDGNSATFGSSSGQQGYFNLRGTAAGSPSDYTVTNVTGDIYRISATLVAGSSSGSGFLRWSNANAGEIEITGFQIVEGSTLTDYVETNADISGFGYVTTWYDQSGNGNDATNSTESEQPLVVSGGTLVEENSKAALDFDGVDDNLNSVGADLVTGNSPYAAFTIAKSTTTVSSDYYFGINATQNGAGAGSTSTLTPEFAIRVNGNCIFSDSASGSQELLSLLYDGTTIQNHSLHINGTSSAVSSSANGTSPMNIASGDFRIGGWGVTAGYLNGTIQEIIIFDSNQSSNRTGMETNIDDHFNIDTP